jgi:hypothetical protein
MSKAASAIRRGEERDARPSHRTTQGVTMSKFVLLYQGGSQPQSPDEGAQVMAAWMAWFGSAGSAILDAGNAFGAETAVGAPLSASGVNGYSLVEGDSLDAVAALIGDHPHLAAGGRIEVHATMEM